MTSLLITDNAVIFIKIENLIYVDHKSFKLLIQVYQRSGISIMVFQGR